ncbi:MAG TPA: hypothetical protein VGD08_03020 [Stellaceae bacterium]
MPGACDAATARAILEEMRGDPAGCRVFLELGRPDSAPAAAPPNPFAMHAIPLAGVMAHTGIADASRLATYLGAINELYRTATGWPGGIVALDPRGMLYVHEATHRCIGELWGHLAEALSGEAAALPAAPRPDSGVHGAAVAHPAAAAAAAAPSGEVTCAPPYHIAHGDSA